jgi:saccharopine dehydrogenase (NAD+, L-lysine-forming)
MSDLGADVFREGRWKNAGISNIVGIDFGYQFGKRRCYPMNLEEMWALPEMLRLGELGIYSAGLNWFVDYLVIPAAFSLGKVSRGLGRAMLTNLMVWGLKQFSPPEEEVVLVLEAKGRCKADRVNVRLVVEHKDAYYITAAPVVACMRQYLDGMIKPGLNILGHAVDPELLIEDLRRMGIKVDLSLS